jgi:hypothetical protein
MNTINEEWDSFSHLLIDAAPAQHVADMRTAFYAGAYSLLCMQARIFNNHGDAEATRAIFEALEEELDTYLSERSEIAIREPVKEAQNVQLQ